MSRRPQSPTSRAVYWQNYICILAKLVWFLPDRNEWVTDRVKLHACEHSFRHAGLCLALCADCKALRVGVCACVHVYICNECVACIQTHSIRCTQYSTRNNQLSTGISSVLQQHLMLSHSNRYLTLLTRSAGCRPEKCMKSGKWQWKGCVCKKQCLFEGWRKLSLSLSLCLSVSLIYEQGLS